MRFAIALALVGLGLAGCADRQHVYYKTGAATRAALAKQAEPREGPAPRGLDAEDAEIVLTNYRAASTRKASGAAGGQAAGTQGPSDFGSPSEMPGGPPPSGIQLQAK